MVPVMFDPFKELREIEKRISTMLDLEKNMVPSTQSETIWMPAVNEREDEKAYYVEVDLPGVKKEDINVEVKDNVLVLSGERKFKKEEEDKGYKRVESFFGKFERRFTLPADADAEKIEAKVEDGVLTIVIPKVEQKENTKKIEIK
ncbi:MULTISPECIES: Hsp20/alpha crystallin family protein [unclassified Nitratiruptor]|uniref:Hsp20/alpha crystallin family protein n=1 Tax=unclassified Nitratiruptor TaxID=2624044 RepID=UPI00191505F3|nr:MULTISPECIES: Hsp20/alpha crystallin family protein [unclassified Nitratiruptor]BCD60927.1 HSP20 family protein [Nitratiruptor sp. YY08-10]BCD64859.1 HSP20 family protein [Nitratiruptor sp. YY08-14]